LVGNTTPTEPAITSGGASGASVGSSAGGSSGGASVGVGVAPPHAARSMAAITNNVIKEYSFLDISDLLLIEIFLIIQVY
jgi:predicted flavoprotein YhiN